jgi:hypothetical protein
MAAAVMPLPTLPSLTVPACLPACLPAYQPACLPACLPTIDCYGVKSGSILNLLLNRNL